MTPNGQAGGHHRRAAVDGQFLDFLGGHGLPEGGVFGIEKGRVGGDFHRGGDVADIQFEIDHRMVAGADIYALAEGCFEARRLHGDIVFAGQKERGGVLAGVVGNGGDLGAGLGFGDRHLRPGDSGAGGIGDRAADGAAEFLSEERGGKKQCERVQRTWS